ncbi:MAG: 3-hydroxyacyl-[acyl-carrier-protein] dehydratase FabZ [Candidatus Melainabacteria bacterium GWF2_37_15]|nr:MAG: 3-hydroxyacyl-[acyl-carrier-protein] dehydratase FabZ [Candidatus Melainabacteria bacterium GWF2_37_15]
MDIMEIMKLIPHRYPFLLVDRITECVPGKYVKGFKNITMNEALFQGHFPGNPIFPGVLMVEALAQISAGMVMTMPQYAGKLALFAGIDGVRFKKVVRPGDKLEFHSEIIKLKGPIAKTKCTATVDGELAVEAELMCAIQ